MPRSTTGIQDRRYGMLDMQKTSRILQLWEMCLYQISISASFGEPIVPMHVLLFFMHTNSGRRLDCRLYESSNEVQPNAAVVIGVYMCLVTL